MFLMRVVQIEQYERGLLYRDGRFVRVLDPGRHREWSVPFLHVRVTKVDLRQRPVAIHSQEIITQDRVSLRMNVVGCYRIVDPVKALHEVADAPGQLYTDLQLALREIVGAIPLDALLADKGSVSAELLARARDKARLYGIELVDAGLKDLILPGEMKEILNRVLTAQKAAEAALIQRREEVAATRSLANTAALLEKNPILLRLKELEVLERIMQTRGNTVVLGLPTNPLDLLRVSSDRGGAAVGP
jgi:regulator of protease activity HflC (stomatin/prohibitin superfamily)